VNFDDINRLLDEFARLPRLPEPDKTFMEIAGYPHYENVASNILEFFLNPENGTGLEALLLESLLASAGVKTSELDLEVTNVSREAPTASVGVRRGARDQT
jgi:hypothetical protein